MMARYFSGRVLAPPDVGRRSPSDGSAFCCPVGGESSILPVPSPPVRPAVVPRPGAFSRRVGAARSPVRVGD